MYYIISNAPIVLYTYKIQCTRWGTISSSPLFHPSLVSSTLTLRLMLRDPNVISGKPTIHLAPVLFTMFDPHMCSYEGPEELIWGNLLLF